MSSAWVAKTKQLYERRIRDQNLNTQAAQIELIPVKSRIEAGHRVADDPRERESLIVKAADGKRRRQMRNVSSAGWNYPLLWSRSARWRLSPGLRMFLSYQTSGHECLLLYLCPTQAISSDQKPAGQ